MSTNLERFKNDLDKLIEEGRNLRIAMRLKCNPKEMKEAIEKQLGGKTDLFIKDLPDFRGKYQSWYSEALALLRQLLPNRVADFARHYDKPKGRKDINNENYCIEDYLQDLTVTRKTGFETETIVGMSVAIPRFDQQLSIVEAAKRRFDSSLFEIRQLVQADLVDSEITAAEELAKHKFVRAAGALAGVVLERHLAQVCEDHTIAVAKKNPTIGDFNEALKAAGTIDLPQWRFIQHLGDIRNLCDHGRKPDPTPEQVSDLLNGVKKVIKTVY